MCEKCNESLVAAATAANLLAEAASKLYNINQHAESPILGKAAAALFKPAEEIEPMVTGSAEKGAPGNYSQVKDERQSINDLLPEGMYISENGLLYLNDALIGKAVLVQR